MAPGGRPPVILVFRRSRSLAWRMGALAVLVLAVVGSALVGVVKASAATLAVDVQVTTQQSSAAASITSPTFTTHQANEVLIAFLTSDGPNRAGGETFSAVTGGGLTWSLRARANSQPGTAEIWQAVAPQTLTNVSVTAMRASGSYIGTITVVSFSGADTSRTGATNSGSASTGGPTVSLTTTVGNSWVWGVGNDWSRATARTPGSNQTVVDQYLAPVGDTYWTQRQNATTANAGTAVTINDTAPTNDTWDLAAIEVVPQGSTGTSPPTAPTNLAATAVNSAEVDLSWTASTSSVGVAGYTVTRNSTVIGTSPNTTFNDTTVSAGTTYTYTVTAFDTQGNVSGPSNTVTATTPSRGLDQTGQWASLINWPIVAVHGAMLPNGKIVTWGDGSSTPTIWDPAANSFTNVPNAFANPMCGGLNALPDGRIITIGGGGLSPPRHHRDHRIQRGEQQLGTARGTSFQTWYASSAVLPNGNLIRIGGVNGCNNCNPEVPEVYSPATNRWNTLSSNPTLLPMYPFTYVRPDGTVAVTGASEVTSALRIYDPTTQTWTTSDPNVVEGGSSAMYDTGKVIKAGSATDSGQPPNPSASTAYITDLGQATPKWTQTGSMAYPRSFLNLTPLPDGTVLATGGETTRDGSNLNNGVLPVEDWNPATGKWTTWASMAIPRLYHSIAMLMPDGRVFVAGTGNDGRRACRMNADAQIFSPPYLFKGPRPTITGSPSVVQYGSNFQVSTPDASSIASVSLVRTAAVTHSFDQSTRRVSLPFTASNGTLNVQAPADGAAAPPGHYMLFIVNGNGVPSVASWVHLPAPYEDAVASIRPKRAHGHGHQFLVGGSVMDGVDRQRRGDRLQHPPQRHQGWHLDDNLVRRQRPREQHDVHLHRHRLRRGRERQCSVELRNSDNTRRHNAAGDIQCLGQPGRHLGHDHLGYRQAVEQPGDLRDDDGVRVDHDAGLHAGHRALANHLGADTRAALPLQGDQHRWVGQHRQFTRQHVHHPGPRAAGDRRPGQQTSQRGRLHDRVTELQHQTGK